MPKGRQVRSGAVSPLPGCPSRDPVQCIIPPHIFDAIVKNGTQAQRNRLLDEKNNTLAISQALRAARLGFDETHRAEREAARSARLAAGRPWRAVPFEPHKEVDIYSAGNSQRLPGTRVRSQGDPPSGDVAVDEAYDYMGKTFDFYWNIFNRNSIDDAGMTLSGTVHYGQNFDNAFWDGQRMIYGDGDKELFQRFTIDIDVIGHELTHGVTQYEAGLIYWSQSGALNESISDVFGTLVKQYALNQNVQQADWLIGANLFIPGAVKGKAIRSMAAPGTAFGYPVPDPNLGTDPQPAHMKDYVKGIQDNGGVHTNSGIPNHAFYLVAMKLGGYAWEKAGLIWYTTLLDPRLRRMSKFQSFARLTFSVATQLFPGLNTPEQQAVRDGWAGVGITV